MSVAMTPFCIITCWLLALPCTINAGIPGCAPTPWPPDPPTSETPVTVTPGIITPSWATLRPVGIWAIVSESITRCCVVFWTSTIGDSPVTVIVSSTVPTRISMSTDAANVPDRDPLAADGIEPGQAERHAVGAWRQADHLVAAGIVGRREPAPFRSAPGLAASTVTPGESLPRCRARCPRCCPGRTPRPAAEGPRPTRTIPLPNRRIDVALPLSCPITWFSHDVGFHLDPSGSFRKSELVMNSWFRYFGSLTMVVTVNHSIAARRRVTVVVLGDDRVLAVRHAVPPEIARRACLA